ncbi:hypothetical protein, partial [Allorhizocola rhizosphaerae]|uniref:hypothetical protein n=1 Tax=Allorhizocola rhizosphaerae TaxID=1872709 RepID=UPI001B8B48E5
MNKDRFEPDAATLVSDDELLDALGRGEWPSKDDEPLALAFALWRDDIVRPAAAPSPEVQPARKAKHGNKFRWGLISGVVAALLGSGLAFAAVVEAQPGDGPIWGISERFFPERAQGKSVAAAQLALVEARTAISEDRLDLAERKVNEAEGLIGKVKSLTEVQQLQAELAVVRDLLNTARVRLGTVVPAP